MKESPMHGIIHAELKKYIETRYSPDTWKTCLEAAGLRGQVYLSIGAYPDAEAVAIVTAAAKLTGVSVEQLLEGLGEFMVPDLFSLYYPLIKPEWKTIEMLLQTEAVIHRVVRLQNPGAEPPKLHFEQVGPKELKFYYNSPRRMAAVAKGIMKGVANHYGESILIREQKKADGSSEMSIIVT
jgi:hypothetical protein